MPTFNSQEPIGQSDRTNLYIIIAYRTFFF